MHLRANLRQGQPSGFFSSKLQTAQLSYRQQARPTIGLFEDSTSAKLFCLNILYNQLVTVDKRFDNGKWRAAPAGKPRPWGGRPRESQLQVVMVGGKSLNVRPAVP
jgi:hypothetical protein